MTTQSPIFTTTAAIAAGIIGVVWGMAWFIGVFYTWCRNVDGVVDDLIRALDE